MDRQYDGALFLADVTEKIKTRLEEIDRSLAEGQQEIENMHEYYWRIIRRWTSMAMRITIISRRCCIR